MPLTTSARSTESIGLDSEWCSWRTTPSRFAAYRRDCSSFSPLAGLKKHSRTVTPVSLTGSRSTLTVPRWSIASATVFRNR